MFRRHFFFLTPSTIFKLNKRLVDWYLKEQFFGSEHFRHQSPSRRDYILKSFTTYLTFGEEEKFFPLQWFTKLVGWYFNEEMFSTPAFWKA